MVKVVSKGSIKLLAYMTWRLYHMMGEHGRAQEAR
jgi:hypothetical protein